MGKASALFRLPEVSERRFSTRCGLGGPVPQTRAGGEDTASCLPDTSGRAGTGGRGRLSPYPDCDGRVLRI